MPKDWVTDVIQRLTSPPICLEHIANTAQVSRQAAVIALNICMSEGYVYTILDDAGIVVSSGRSAGTLANAPEQGTRIERHRMYPISDEMWESKQNEGLYVWWHFPSEAELPKATERRGWREILDEMLEIFRFRKVSVKD